MVSNGVFRAGFRAAAGASLGHLCSERVGLSRSRAVCCEATAAKDQTLKQFLKSAHAQKWVELNADKSRSCLVNTDESDWIQTGAGGVRRKLIERLGGEVARATTVVNFDANAMFPAHVHEGGEEFIVLRGEWYDDWAAQPRYTYVRNYIGSRHTPRIGASGATILVKLCQMSKDHQEASHSQWDISAKAPGWRSCPDVAGRQILEVFSSPFERVRFERWEPGAQGEVSIPAEGEEVFVMEGGFADELGVHRTWSWARNATATTLHRVATDDGCMLYIKSHHLRSPEVDIYAMQPEPAKL